MNSDYENLQHRFKIETANQKIDSAKLQREFLEQQEQFKIQIQGFIKRILSLFSDDFVSFRFRIRRKNLRIESDKSRLQKTIQEKEHQLLTNIQLTREDEWKKISEITNEK